MHIVTVARKCHYANQNGTAIQNQRGRGRGGGRREAEGDGERALLNKAI